MKTLFLGCLAAAASCLTNLAGAVDHPNILWSHRSNGQNKVWFMGNAGDGTLTLKTGETSLPTNADPAWQMVGRGHFNKGANAGQDSHTDILWWHPASKLSVVWFMSSGNTIIGTAWLPQNGDPDWTPMAVGDVDADGHADVIWQKGAYTAVWYLNPGNVNVTSITIAQGVLSNTLLTDLSYKIAAAGDADNDGDDDFVWHHALLGTVAFWHFQSRPGSRNGNLVAATNVGLFDDDPDWDLVGAGQYNNAGTADLLWRHNTTGLNQVWLLAGGVPEQPSKRWATHSHDIDWRICNQRRLESTTKLSNAIAHPGTYFLRLIAHSAPASSITFEFRTEPDEIWGQLRVRRREVLGAAATNAASFGSWTHRQVTFQNNMFSDLVAIGQRYEYEVYRSEIAKAESQAPDDRNRLTVAIEGEPVDQPGSVLLVVANNISANPTLSSKIETLRTDLIAEGWKVYRSVNAPMHDDNVWSNNPSRISTVKTLIRNYYINDLSLHTVLLIGHVAVPYSGQLPSDGHRGCNSPNEPDHNGAWSADLYYADVANEGMWLSPVQTNSYNNCHNTVNDIWEGSGKWLNDSFPDVHMHGPRITVAAGWGRILL